MAEGKINITRTTRQIAFLFGLTISTITTNVLIGISYKTIIVFLIASLFYILLSNINTLNYSSNRDAIQSGNAAIAIITAILIIKFYSNNIIIISIIMCTVLILFKSFIEKVLSPKNIDIIYIGLIINIIAFSIIVFFFNSNETLILSNIGLIFSGYINSINISLFTLLFFLFLPILLYIIFFFNRNELILYSAGKEYHTITYIGYNGFNLIINIIKSFFLTISIIFSGILSLIGCNLLNNISSEYDKIPIYLIIIFYSQIILLAISFIYPPYVIVFSFIMSYLIYFSFNFKDLKINKIGKGEIL